MAKGKKNKKPHQVPQIKTNAELLGAIEKHKKDKNAMASNN